MNYDLIAIAKRLADRDLADYQGPTGDDTDMRAGIVLARAYLAANAELEGEVKRLRESLAGARRAIDKILETEHGRVRGFVDALAAENERLRESNTNLLDLIAELNDDAPCVYDHHDLCQSHFLGERPCPFERAKAIVAEAEKARES